MKTLVQVIKEENYKIMFQMLGLEAQMELKEDLIICN